MSTLVARLRAEVDEHVNEPLDRLLDEAADRIERLERELNELTLAALVTVRRPAPTPDKINEAFKRATDC